MKEIVLGPFKVDKKVDAKIADGLSDTMMEAARAVVRKAGGFAIKKDGKQGKAYFRITGRITSVDAEGRSAEVHGVFSAAAQESIPTSTRKGRANARASVDDLVYALAEDKVKRLVADIKSGTVSIAGRKAKAKAR